MEIIKKKMAKRASLWGVLLLLAVVLVTVGFVSVRPAYAVDCTDPDDLALNCLEGIFGNVLKGVLALVGLLSFLFIIKGGLNYTMAGGDMKAIDAARKTLTWAVIGLGFAIAAFAAMKLLSDTFGANILRFDIPPP